VADRLSEDAATERVRRAALLLAVLTVPFLIVGAALTVSVFGALFGIPILAGSWLVWRSARRARRAPVDPGARRRLTAAAAAFSVVLSVALGVAVVLGRDDLDAPVDVLGLVVAVGWLAGAWWATAVTVRAAGAGR
jgi:hypothetical protein